MLLFVSFCKNCLKNISLSLFVFMLATYINVNVVYCNKKVVSSIKKFMLFSMLSYIDLFLLLFVCLSSFQLKLCK